MRTKCIIVVIAAVVALISVTAASASTPPNQPVNQSATSTTPSPTNVPTTTTPGPGARAPLYSPNLCVQQIITGVYSNMTGVGPNGGTCNLQINCPASVPYSSNISCTYSASSSFGSIQSCSFWTTPGSSTASTSGSSGPFTLGPLTVDPTAINGSCMDSAQFSMLATATVSVGSPGGGGCGTSCGGGGTSPSIGLYCIGIGYNNPCTTSPSSITVTAGQNITPTWSCNSSTAAQIYDSFIQAGWYTITLSNHFSTAILPVGANPMTLSCINGSQQVQRTIMVNVVAGGTGSVKLAVSPNAVWSTTGARPVIQWSSLGQTSCTASGASFWTGSKSTTGGSQTLGTLPVGNYTLSYACKTASGVTTTVTAALGVADETPLKIVDGGDDVVTKSEGVRDLAGATNVRCFNVVYGHNWNDVFGQKRIHHWQVLSVCHNVVTNTLACGTTTVVVIGTNSLTQVRACPIFRQIGVTTSFPLSQSGMSYGICGNAACDTLNANGLTKVDISSTGSFSGCVGVPFLQQTLCLPHTTTIDEAVWGSGVVNNSWSSTGI